MIERAAAIDIDTVREHVNLALESFRTTNSDLKISERLIRGSGAVTLAQVTIQVVVHVDVAHVLLAIAAVLAATQARVILNGKSVRIVSVNDVRKFVAADGTISLPPPGQKEGPERE